MQAGEERLLQTILIILSRRAQTTSSCSSQAAVLRRLQGTPPHSQLRLRIDQDRSGPGLQLLASGVVPVSNHCLQLHGRVGAEFSRRKHHVTTRRSNSRKLFEKKGDHFSTAIRPCDYFSLTNFQHIISKCVGTIDLTLR